MLIGAAIVYAWLIEPNKIQVKEFDVAFPNFPAEFDGYSILHLTDLHINAYGRAEKRLASLISSREVDACLITGDVTINPRATDSFRRLCSSIVSHEPIFLVLGNSEHKPWLDTPTLVMRSRLMDWTYWSTHRPKSRVAAQRS